MPNLRLPLFSDIEFRSFNVLKDAYMQNCFAEKGEEETVYIIKRPGLTEKYAATAGTNTNFGLFCYEGIVYSWDTSTPWNNPNEVIL